MPRNKKQIRGFNLAQARFPEGNTTPRKEQEEGDYWKKMNARPSNTVTSSAIVPLSTAIETLRVHTNELKDLLDDKEQEIDALQDELRTLQRQISLRSRSSTDENSQAKTPHYIPDTCTGDRGNKNGRPLCYETLQLVASVCASGSQYSKACLLRHILATFLTYLA